MAKLTPTIDSVGKYTVKNPWTINTAINYKCIAIRSFEDLYKAGFDPYTDFYKPVGLTIENSFDFKAETALNPNIISLKGDDGSVLYIPDTYILTMPVSGDVPYQQVIIACSLGMLPDTYDVSILAKDVADFIGSRVGHTVTSKVITTPSTLQPTMQEHLQLETARKAAITVRDNLTTENIKLTQLNTKLQDKLNATLAVLRNNNLLNG